MITTLIYLFVCFVSVWFFVIRCLGAIATGASSAAAAASVPSSVLRSSAANLFVLLSLALPSKSTEQNFSTFG